MVEIKAMTFGYGKKKKLFEALDMRLEPGSIYGLLGLNGAGKTSLLKIAAGALLPGEGGVSVFGQNPRTRSAAVLADLVFVPEDPWVPALRPSQWLAQYACFRPSFDYAAFAKLLREFAIEEDKQLTKYSYGQRKKFALAAAIASKARLVLLDEPTNGLDIPSKTQFRRVLASSASTERIFVVSTHQVRDLENLIDPIVILDSGKVSFNLSAETLGERLACARLASLEGRAIVHAEKDAMGWTALLPREGREDETTADLEMIFNAAMQEPARLRAAIEGSPLRGAGSSGEVMA